MYWSIVRRRLRGRSVPLSMVALLLTLGCATASTTAAAAPRPPVVAEAVDAAGLWVEPADLATRDLSNGPGCEDRAPAVAARFTFLTHDAADHAWSVRDDSGMTWDVIDGHDARPSIAASRLLWAIGYHQPPMYYVERWTVVGGDEAGPKDAARFATDLDGWQRKGSWSWARNPFAGTQPYRGLIVLMHMLGSGDLLDRHTAAYAVVSPSMPAPRSLFVVAGLGSALGRSRAIGGGAAGDADDFEAQGFVKGVDRDGHVKLDATLLRDDRLHAGITPADVRWACERLGRLSPKQWADAFRAAHYEPAVADRFVRRLQEKVRMGLMLGASPTQTARAGRP